ncbi:MAG: 2-phospho-L-lactate transferase [Thermoleophilia bacterium]
MRITVLAGGVGAARFLDGLVRVVPAGEITVVGNVADDLELLGLRVSPDLDTVLYTLAGIVHPEQGWGRADETRNALAVVSELGGEDWFLLGDRDLGLHLVRTQRLRAGEPLSAVTADICRRLGVGVRLLPATDDRLTTMVDTERGEVDFQTYFVRWRHDVDVHALRVEGAAAARPAPGVVEAIEQADVLVVAPSNPYLSVDPILAVPGVREAVLARSGPSVAVSPIVGGRAIKGPADRLMRTFAGEVSAVAVARHYAPWLTHLLVDAVDRELLPQLVALGVRAAAADTIMRDASARARVARAALELAAG